MVPLTLRLREDSLSGQRARPTVRLWGDRLVRERRRKTYRTQLTENHPSPLQSSAQNEPLRQEVIQCQKNAFIWPCSIIVGSKTLYCTHRGIWAAWEAPLVVWITSRGGRGKKKRLGPGMVYGNHTIKVLSSGKLSRKHKAFRSPAKSDMTGPDSTPLPPRALGGSTCTTHWHTVLRSSYLLPQMPTYPFLAPRGLKYRAIQSSDPARNL